MGQNIWSPSACCQNSPQMLYFFVVEIMNIMKSGVPDRDPYDQKQPHETKHLAQQHGVLHRPFAQWFRAIGMAICCLQTIGLESDKV